MPSLKTILTLAVSVALGAASLPLTPASAQVFISRMDQGKKACAQNHGTFKQDNPTSPTSDSYTCTYANKIDSCVASTGKCTTKETPAARPAAAAPAKSLAGTGDVSNDALKKICARNKEWLFSVESSGAYSCVDASGGIAMNCTKQGRCTENHTQVHAR